MVSGAHRLLALELRGLLLVASRYQHRVRTFSLHSPTEFELETGLAARAVFQVSVRPKQVLTALVVRDQPIVPRSRSKSL